VIYRKNVGRAERVLRAVAGVGLVGYAVLQAGLTPLGIGLALAGMVAVLTGMVGFCPACAMVGRRPVDGPR
jgi:hypothetical protein